MMVLHIQDKLAKKVKKIFKTVQTKDKQGFFKEDIFINKNKDTYPDKVIQIKNSFADKGQLQPEITNLLTKNYFTDKITILLTKDDLSDKGQLYVTGQFCRQLATNSWTII